MRERGEREDVTVPAARVCPPAWGRVPTMQRPVIKMACHRLGVGAAVAMGGAAKMVCAYACLPAPAQFPPPASHAMFWREEIERRREGGRRERDDESVQRQSKSKACQRGRQGLSAVSNPLKNAKMLKQKEKPTTNHQSNCPCLFLSILSINLHEGEEGKRPQGTKANTIQGRAGVKSAH